MSKTLVLGSRNFVPNVGNLARSYPVSLRISSAMVSPRKGRGKRLSSARPPSARNWLSCAA
jgi:hypothetical protein